MIDHAASDRSPSELEREADRVRAEIADTAEHLKDKMSPGQLMDEVVDYLKDGDANQLLSNLKTQVRDNPLALAMVGGGLAWLMMGSGPATRMSSASHAPAMPTTPQYRPAAAVDASTSLRSGTQGSDRSAMAKGADAVRDKGASVAASIGHTASSAKDSVAATAHDLRDAAGDYMSSASQAGADAGHRLKSTFMDALEREPLVLGALGVAVGAAIGAMLPATRTEQEYLGDVSRKARDTAEAALEEGLDKAKHVAGDVYSAAKAEADRQGLMPGDKPMADKVAEVAKSAGGELKSATDASLHQGRDTADKATDHLSARDKRN